jgi:hypothetical protein
MSKYFHGFSFLTITTEISANASGELLATDDHLGERDKAYAVGSQLDWNVRPSDDVRIRLYHIFSAPFALMMEAVLREIENNFQGVVDFGHDLAG